LILFLQVNFFKGLIFYISLVHTNYQLSQGKKWWRQHHSSSQSDIEILLSKCQDDGEFIYKPTNKARNKKQTMDYRVELEKKQTQSEIDAYLAFVVKDYRGEICPLCSKGYVYSKTSNREAMSRLFYIWSNSIFLTVCLFYFFPANLGL
jgi:hypothetical protein